MLGQGSQPMGSHTPSRGPSLLDSYGAPPQRMAVNELRPKLPRLPDWTYNIPIIAGSDSGCVDDRPDALPGPNVKPYRYVQCPAPLMRNKYRACAVAIDSS